MSDWRERGACRGRPPHWWYPDGDGAIRGRPRNDGLIVVDENVANALELCASCPVLLECRQWAIAHEADGIWGGLTEKERRRERRRLGIRLNEPTLDVDSWRQDRAEVLFRQGWTIREIAIELRAHEKQVNRWLDARGIDAYPPPRWITESAHEDIRMRSAA